jgi:ABC-type branched-subunit amino acid transport system ATPase component
VSDLTARRLVPTSRQESEGITLTPEVLAETEAVATSADSPEPEQAPVLSKLQLFRAYVGELDPRSITGPKLPLFVFLALALFTNLDDAVYLVVLPELRSEFGGNASIILSVNLGLGIVAGLMAPLFGLLVDRVKRVRLVQISQIGNNAVTLLSPLRAHSLLGVSLYRIGGGLLGGAQSSAPATLMPDYYRKKDYTKVLVLLPAATALAGVYTPIVAGWAVERFGGWRPATLILGFIATAVSLLSLLLREPKRRSANEPDDEDEVADDEVVDDDVAEQLLEEPVAVKPPPVAEAVRILRGIRTLRSIWFAMIFSMAANQALVTFLALYWAEKFGLTPSQRGYLQALGFAGQFVVLLASAPLISRIAARKPSRVLSLFGLATAGTSIFAVIIGWSHSLPLSIVASIPLSVGGTALAPALALLMVRILPAEVRGVGITSIAPFQIAGQVGLIFLIQFGGIVSGTSSLAYIVAAASLVAGIILSSGARHVDRDIRAAAAADAARAAGVADEEGEQGALLVCRDVEVQYNGTVVIDNIDLDVGAGEFLALLGTNGAGKSTLLKVICGIVPATNGAIFFDGRNITFEPPHLNVAHGVVMMPGGRAVFPTLTVRENLRTAGLARSDDEAGTRTIEQVLDMFPALRERLDQRAGDLSGGEQQMVALGQALLMRPRLLMIDELSLGLAPAIVEQLLDVLREINAGGTTVIVVEQSVNVALTVARRAIFMDKGAIRFDGPTEELLARPDLVRSVFMGGAITGGSVRAARRRGVEESPDVLAVDDVGVSFGGIQALDSVSLTVGPQEIVGILGPNGAGKTTLFDCISGFIEPTHGTVAIDGIDVSALAPDARARLGLARSFQDARLFPSMTVRENIAVAFERLASKNAAAALAWSPSVRRSEERINRRVDGLIDLLALGPLADKFVSELSTGSRRAVDVAVVMAAEPKILLLDEPSSGLAQAEVESLGPVIQRLARESGAGVLVIEHDLPLLSSISHRMVAMERGRVVCIGAPLDVVRDPRVLASYLNASERVLGRSGDRMSSIASALGATPEPATDDAKD